jgi:large subunit ribosomal protein L13e
MGMRHNNVLANVHLRKSWQHRVKSWFDQAQAKSRRSRLRTAKAARIAPRPVDGLLRPVVHCPTFKYNSKVRAGRGFTLAELKAAGIPKKQAQTIGIAVDYRRRNSSVESLQLNAERLKAYKARLVVFPRKAKSPKKSDTPAAELAQLKSVKSVRAAFPVVSKAAPVEVRAITADEKAFNAYVTLRKAQSEAKYFGVREKWTKEKAAAEAEKAK